MKQETEDVPLSALKGENRTDEELAPKIDRWRSQTPLLTQDDQLRAGKIVERLMEKVGDRTSSVWKVWKELSERAREEFLKIGLMAHIEIVVRCIDEETQVTVDLKQNTTERIGYLIHDGEILIPPGFISVAISPVVVIDDYQDIDIKKGKASDTIEQRQRRQVMGQDYFGRNRNGS